MTVRAIGDVVANRMLRADTRRTHQPVRRNSRHAGEREGRLWRPIADGTRQGAGRWRGALIRAARDFDRANKKPNRWNGPLGAIAIEVLEELLRLVDFKTGRLEPALLTIAGRLKRSKVAVVAALARLKEHGFLDWVRRSEPTGNAEGPQVRQITNAYGFDEARLPKTVRAFLRKVLGNGPPPDCEVARDEQRKAELDGMLERAAGEEVGRYHGGDSALGDVLARIGAALDRSASSPGGLKPGQGD